MVTDAPYELPIDDTELYVAGKRDLEASSRYSDGTLSHTPRPLAKVVVGAAGNTARRTWAFRVRQVTSLSNSVSMRARIPSRAFRNAGSLSLPSSPDGSGKDQCRRLFAPGNVGQDSFASSQTVTT